VTPDEPVLRRLRWTRFIVQAPLWLSKYLWVWPLLGALLLGGVGFWVRNRVEESTREELNSRLETVLKADIAALRLWFSEREADTMSFAADVSIQAAIAELAALAQETDTSSNALLRAQGARLLQSNLRPLLGSQRYLDYLVVGPDRRVLASPHHWMVGHLVPLGYDRAVRRALDGRPAVSQPFVHIAPNHRTEGPTMCVAGPVRGTNGQVIAVLGIRMKPEAEFSSLFSVARMGETGEAYAFNRAGMMLTASRFDPELKAQGLIPNTTNSTSILNLRLVDPGAKPPQTKAAEPRLTRMAESATHGMDGCDVNGYRNYRGVRVVGAWAWLPDYGMGVATEVAATEAFQMLITLRLLFLVLFVLLVLSALGIFGFMLLVERLQANLRKSALELRQLGQYVLVQEIGRGASGMVYRARHTLLRRPVAIKLLSPELTNQNTIAHFEREVQMTSQLTHPNTVAIYDYGRTPEGLFYYAMEFLSGIDLDQLVRQFGPQPEGRVVFILRQICGSLAEAHRIGLIHRDIKPANVVLSRRGGLCDVVKVLDFGLVKSTHGTQDHTATRTIVGTPHFMSPEAVQKPDAADARSDLYSLGAVGYWLLTGKTVFDADQLEPLLAQQVSQLPQRPGERLGRPCSADLEGVLLQCLEKSPDQRPKSAEALDRALAGCAAASAWTTAEAEHWWWTNPVSAEPMPASQMVEKTLVIAPRD
jgi:eukaryotic-like serine/threonine-protein kinase